jgi:ATP-dependent RNA helicase SUPV3L1/SUV3
MASRDRPLRDLSAPPTITAALGPTNTGKTYRAIQRMLGHADGMIGLPLRLLAREVYDRCVEKVGAGKVALVTGEEKIVPHGARYWVCTTESMPVSRTVDFVGIDEIQLATHRERGHTFTDRILNLRGRRETWFMGSDAMTPVIQRLVPTAELERYERFSQLSHTGACPITALPPRSAVVAFSAAHVFELAERLRVRKGGAAVVIGALSPRARNRQVEMYAAGEVQYMVATDAIGMGLNLDLDHVAFASLSKFDGQSHRPLEAPELAQIAGRAGRHRRDGTFGTLTTAGELDPALVADIEAHRFPPIKRIWWRNTDLDFSSLRALDRTLHKGAALRNLMPSFEGDDLEALSRLSRMPEVRARCDSEARVALLWEVCRIPDFRQTMVEAHVNLLAQVFLQLTGKRACLSADWVAEGLARVDRVEGDIETLMTRIAYVRTWTTIAHHRDWLADPEAWQAKARDIEDRLSDALHEQLRARYVDQRATAIARERAHGRELEVDVGEDGAVTALGLELGALQGFGFALSEDGGGPEAARVRSAARGALQDTVKDRVAALLDAPDDQLGFDDAGALCWTPPQGAPLQLGRLEGTEELWTPGVRLFSHELLDSHQRQKIHERLVAFVRAWVAELRSSLYRVEDRHLHHEARAIRYALEQGLGCAARGALRREVKGLSGLDRRNLARMDVRIGTYVIYVDSWLRPERVRDRALLMAAQRKLDRLPELPPEGAISVPVSGDADWYRAIGYLPLGPRALRADQTERLLYLLRTATRSGPGELPAAAASWFGCNRTELTQMAAALGYRQDDEGRFHQRRPPRRGRGRRGRR